MNIIFASVPIMGYAGNKKKIWSIPVFIKGLKDRIRRHEKGSLCCSWGNFGKGVRSFLSPIPVSRGKDV